ncbi:murein biosynthesis integral membrane protein MurJ [Microaceticoccus formicicus]|uniref:murein biosynthesis integral membrane protein MurJ n=1 Tax=Microaceticoccus formicicus TaxID=3118105 RepID=UPI003CD00E5E|nr:murein biosynthesis integral membrane protein MurJ [Peptoniphilaceae bacterium AMB_02]
MAITGILLIIVQIFSKVLGFFREVVLSNYHGASFITDAFLVAMTLPVHIFSIFSSAIAVSFIPVYNKIKDADGEIVSEKYTSNLINVTFILTVIISILLYLFTKPLVKIIAVGFNEQTFLLAINLTRIAIFSILFLGMTSILVPYLNINNKFVIPSMIGIPLNLSIILGIVLSSKTSITMLAYGILLGHGLQLILLLPSLHKVKYKHTLRIKLNDENLKYMFFLSIPVIIGNSANQLNTIVDRTIASTIKVGALSALSYAIRLNYFTQGIIVIPLVTLMYPKLSNLVTSKKHNELIKLINKYVSFITILIVPTMIGGAILSKEITSVLFLRGAFDENALEMTHIAVKFYILGAGGLAFREVFSRILYAHNDTKTPVRNTVITVVINIILNIILSKLMGIGGLALATSISATISAVLMKKGTDKLITNKETYYRNYSKYFKIIVSGVIMGMSILFYKYFCSTTISSFLLFIELSIGIITYIVMLFILKIDEINDIKQFIKDYRIKIK